MLGHSSTSRTENMSDTVEAAIITTSGALFIALIGLVAHRRKTQHQSQPVPQTVVVPAANIPSASHGTAQPVSRRTADLSHKQISDTIKAVPPFHREKIQDGFVGTCVSWRAKYSSIYRHPKEVTVTAHIPNPHVTLFCRSKPEDCEIFVVIPEGADLIVTGEIERVTEYEAQLVNCTFEIPPKAVA
jgi:hypothetical protein